MEQNKTPPLETLNRAPMWTSHLQLSMLWKIRGTESEELLLASRAEEVLCEVAKSGWEQYRPICEAELTAAWQLWSNSEELLVEVAKRGNNVNKSLLEGCQELLAACNCWIAAEEEILELNNLSAKTYILVHKQRDLVWQKYFHIKSWIIFLACRISCSCLLWNSQAYDITHPWFTWPIFYVISMPTVEVTEPGGIKDLGPASIPSTVITELQDARQAEHWISKPSMSVHLSIYWLQASGVPPVYHPWQ